MLYRALQTKMVKRAAEEAPKTKECPKCNRRRDVAKYFGFRTQHGSDGKPERSMPQSYCVDCRKGNTSKSTTH